MTNQPEIQGRASTPGEELIQRLREDADEAATQAGIFSRRNWGVSLDNGNVEVMPGLLDCLTVRLEGIAKGLREAADLLSSHAQQQARLKPGELSVSIRYGVGTEHHVSGPMGLYPNGVAAIVEAVHQALGEHERLAALLDERS